jgi:hypothetical protein
LSIETIEQMGININEFAKGRSASSSMKNMLIASLLSMRSNKGNIKEIKEVMIKKFKDKLINAKDRDLLAVKVDSNL